MIEFVWIKFFLILPLPLLVYLLLPRARSTSGRALKVPFFQDLENLRQTSNGKSSNWLKLLAVIAWILLVCAAARPQWIGEPLSMPISGRDLLLAVDISGSMQAKDMEINRKPVDRLTMIKKVAGEFIERRQGDRIGLILFGTRAYLQAPLSLDRKTVNQLLQEALIGIAGEKTAIGDALGLAVKRLLQRPGERKVLILLTDGANTAGAIDPLKAAELAKEGKLSIYTIGVGADRMMVKSFFGNRLVNPSADLDEKTLQKIAELTGGRYFRAREKKDLEKIYALLDKLEPVLSEDQALRPIRELFFWPLSGALLLAFLLLLVRHKGTK
ncbi:MAG: VWA domain-containing protein [Deltaproteobacteria bacterium]|nr:VWA domain-containing protein [Deltaproteobacteria bacterium]